MPEANKHLYYYKDGETHTISLYTSLAEAGNNALMLQDNNSSLYAALGLPSDSNASHLKTHKNGITWAVLFHMATGVPLVSQLGNELYGIMEITDEGMYPVTTAVNNVWWGTVSPSTIAVAQGQTLTTTATPFSGKAFVNWTIYTTSGTSTSTSNPLSLVINSPTNIVATFS